MLTKDCIQFAEQLDFQPNAEFGICQSIDEENGTNDFHNPMNQTTLSMNPDGNIQVEIVEHLREEVVCIDHKIRFERQQFVDGQCIGEIFSSLQINGKNSQCGIERFIGRKLFQLKDPTGRIIDEGLSDRFSLRSITLYGHMSIHQQCRSQRTLCDLVGDAATPVYARVIQLDR